MHQEYILVDYKQTLVAVDQTFHQSRQTCPVLRVDLAAEDLKDLCHRRVAEDHQQVLLLATTEHHAIQMR